MPETSRPAPKDVERALNRLTPEQFAYVCAEIGILEITLPGHNQAQKAAALVARTKGHPDYSSLIRSINRINPQVWRAPAVRTNVLSSTVISVAAFVIVLLAGGSVLAAVLNSSEPPPPPTDTPTATLPATRTPIPTSTQTPTITPIPSDTLTPTPTETPTHPPTTPATRAPSATPSATLAPAPVLVIKYPPVEVQAPPDGYTAGATETVEFTWILRAGPLAADERYYVRVYNAGGGLVDGYLTSDPWRVSAGAPSGAPGNYRWTVTVVRVDAEGHISLYLTEESGARGINW
jgi:hypothetical protein